ncbi:hypothetical protein N0V93_000467 [Gnomoniopsis smithogilvyi]|uniref:Cell division control protein 14 n=1 Tax=Gnomoniopsis smithogilvyi TaxID=1191159 RepID=A0A9W8Z1Z4_9PEZI|nr:hypothetical protein N0V93_000467 [Gnomoniopsis smithogilvyi]
MEHLLSVAFDNLASFDGPKIKKGLRQIEGLLAQVCLSAHHDAAAAKKNKALNSRDDNNNNNKRKNNYSLSDLSDDAAFREFFKLQDGFQWNIATRLIQTLDKLYAKSDDGSLDLLMLSALDSLQGVLLLHPSSRNLFSRVQSMNLLLDLLEPINCPAIQSATLLVLVVALLETPRNTRTFEQLDGLLTVSSIFKSRSTARDVKFKTMEFLYFYLMPETPSVSRTNSPLQRSPTSKLGRPVRMHTEDVNELSETLSTDQKQRMLGEHLANVDDLVRDLQQYTPFVAAGGK